MPTTHAKWAIRFYTPFEENINVNFVGSFDNAGSRYLDDVIVFSGMYGIPDYLLWYVHKDLVSFNFEKFSAELELFAEGNDKQVVFKERYRILDVRADDDSDRILVIGISEDSAKLTAPLISADLSTLPYNEKRDPLLLLREVLEDTGIMPVIWHEHDEISKQSFKFEYPKFALDSNWTVYDFINYVAEENNLEWTIKNGSLFIGPEGLFSFVALSNHIKSIVSYTDQEAMNAHIINTPWESDCIFCENKVFAPQFLSNFIK